VDIFGQGGVTSEPTEGDVKHAGGLAIVYPDSEPAIAIDAGHTLTIVAPRPA
jgi:hypothetical protein